MKWYFLRLGCNSQKSTSFLYWDDLFFNHYDRKTVLFRFHQSRCMMYKCWARSSIQHIDFRKFLLRRTGNGSTDFFLMAIAHNILKLHHIIQKDRLESHLIVPKFSWQNEAKKKHQIWARRQTSSIWCILFTAI